MRRAARAAFVGIGMGLLAGLVGIWAGAVRAAFSPPLIRIWVSDSAQGLSRKPSAVAGDRREEAFLPQSAQELPGSGLAGISRAGRLSEGEIREMALPLIRRHCAGIPEGLVLALMEVESGYDPYAVSRAGAMGLMQVMPFHFAPQEDPFHIPTNIRRGCQVLARCLEHARSSWSAWWRANPYRSALACYNAGLTGARRGDGWSYAQIVLSLACRKHSVCLR